ncbi:MAG: hypothetical protein JWO31_1936, partial [Phycisphaerales bacterium]|nr:hypothetical protein [Phycisphaerales bacterium]
AAPPAGWAVDGDVLRGQRTAVFAFDRPIDVPAGARLTVRLAQGGNGPQQLIGRARVSFTDAADPKLDPLDAIPDAVRSALAVDPAARTARQAVDVAEHFRSADPGRASQWHELVAARRQAADLAAAGTPVMVMQEMAKPRDTYLLKRGQYDQPDKSQKLTPGLPAALFPPGKPQPRNRLELARWIVSPENPLTARATVNRFWQHLFGTGLVKTSEDFGLQGDPPSHPELLDWLATEFVRSGWDAKALNKLLVTSAAYRQSSRVTPALLERDPDNRLLARGPRQRLDALAVRDNALAAAGLLVPTVGGPPVKPYQPPGLWEEMAFSDKTSIDRYVQGTGDDLYRRTLYTFWKRTVPPPALAIFDAGGRETCTLRTGRTNTPLQALNLLNDVTYVESARAMAARAMREGGETAGERLAYAFRLATARMPDAAEAKMLAAALDRYLATYRADAEAAKKLVTAGESKPAADLDPAEQAAYAAVCNVILNLDEAVTKG